VIGLVQQEPAPVQQQSKLARFELSVLPHMAAAYNLARWLTRNDHDAEDVVQEAYLRAYRFFDGFHGGDGRTWLLAIVRNTCYTWLQQNRKPSIELEDDLPEPDSGRSNPEALLLRSLDSESLRQALDDLPVEFREAIVLRELEGMSYKEIGAVAGIPLGTVMSRLARARSRLEKALVGRARQGGAA
jgi:RNA polymerase sigma-70 factor (ECF subfamily)